MKASQLVVACLIFNILQQTTSDVFGKNELTDVKTSESKIGPKYVSTQRALGAVQDVYEKLLALQEAYTGWSDALNTSFKSAVFEMSVQLTMLGKPDSTVEKLLNTVTRLQASIKSSMNYTLDDLDGLCYSLEFIEEDLKQRKVDIPSLLPYTLQFFKEFDRTYVSYKKIVLGTSSQIKKVVLRALGDEKSILADEVRFHLATLLDSMKEESDKVEMACVNYEASEREAVKSLMVVNKKIEYEIKKLLLQNKSEEKKDKITNKDE